MPLPTTPPASPASLSQNARTVLEKRYLVKDKSGKPTETPEDMNTSAGALMALIAAGAAQDDAAVVRALGFLAAHQYPDGGWREDGDAVTNPNATALCALAIRTAGYDPDGIGWKSASPGAVARPASLVVRGCLVRFDKDV